MAEATASQSDSLPVKHQSWGGLVQQVEKLLADGKHTEAEGFALQALALAEDYPPDDRRTGITLELLSEIYYFTRQHTYGAPVIMRLLQMYRRCLGTDHIDTGTVTHNAARLYHDWTKYDEAKAFYELAIRIKVKNLGEKHPEVQKIQEHYQSLLSAPRKGGVTIKKRPERMTKTGQWEALSPEYMKK